MTSGALSEAIANRSQALGFSVSVAAVERLAHYGATLQRWSTRLNLTGFDLSHGFSSAALDRLLIEPIAAAQLPLGTPPLLVDLGSGGGSPAIPLALLTSPARLTMVEANLRKAAFLRHAARELGLDADVAAVRIEQWVRGHDRVCIDGISVRAVRLEEETVTLLKGHLCEQGWFLRFLPLGQDLTPAKSTAAVECSHPALGTTVSLFKKSPPLS